MSDKKNNNSQQRDSRTFPDEESIRGRFGWETIGKHPIPYINRDGEKYCAVRMVEVKVLNKFLSILHQDVCDCAWVRGYYISVAEGRLLNEINFEHCDYQFGLDSFAPGDLIVKLSDAIEFYNFLDSCHAKLINNESDLLSRSGFIRINKESVVPYTFSNEEKWVPLFYFEGETENLKQGSHKLEGWDLTYLKFCCKVQGIRNELFAQDSCSVIGLNDVKNYFPSGTHFEDYWPKKSLVGAKLLVPGNTQKQSQIMEWVRLPSVTASKGSKDNVGFATAIRSTYPVTIQAKNISVQKSVTSPSEPSIQINYPQNKCDDTQPPPMIPIQQFLADGGLLSHIFVKHQKEYSYIDLTEVHRYKP